MVLQNDSLHDGQTHAGTFELLLRVEPVKRLKEPLRVFHIETDAVVTNEQYALSTLMIFAYLDHGMVTGGGELDGIGNQIHEHLLDQGSVALSDGKRGNLEGHLAVT